MSNDETRLPKWAQSELRRLRSNTSVLEEKLQAFSGAGETKIRVDPHEQNPMYLPNNTTVRFIVAGGKIDMHIRNGRLEVMASAGLGHFSVWPRASNMVWLTFEKDES